MVDLHKEMQAMTPDQTVAQINLGIIMAELKRISDERAVWGETRDAVLRLNERFDSVLERLESSNDRMVDYERKCLEKLDRLGKLENRVEALFPPYKIDVLDRLAAIERSHDPKLSDRVSALEKEDAVNAGKMAIAATIAATIGGLFGALASFVAPHLSGINWK